MNLLERVLTLLRANLDTMVEKADDPEKTLRQLQLDMRNQLVQVKTQVATAIAEGHKLQKQCQERTGEAEKWLHKAELAVQQGNDESARNALAHYNAVNKQLQRYQLQKKEQDQLVLTMRNVLQQLESRILEIDTTLELIATRKRNALLQQRVFDALNKNTPVSEQNKTIKAKEVLIESEARARALAALHQRRLSTQLEELSKEQLVEQQLQKLKHGKVNHSSLKNVRSGPDNTRNTGPLSHIAPATETQTGQKQTGQDINQRRKSLQAPAEPSTSQDLDLEHLQALLDLSENSDS